MQKKANLNFKDSDNNIVEILPKTVAEQVVFTDKINLQDKFYNKKLLWKGSNYMVGPDVVNLPKKISECMNGIVLIWSDYDPGSGNEGNNFNWVTTFVPKTGRFIESSGNTLIAIPRIENSAPASERIIVKALYIKDNKLVGVKANDTNLGNDVVLREVWEV